jgi:hypothetical protein
VTRRYTAEADSPGDAMTIYRSGDAEMDDGELFEANWDEQEQTAQVVTVTIGDTSVFYSVPACAHHGENCDGAEFCCRCRRQIFSGYVFGDERYCDSHKPETWDAEVATMTPEEFDNQDDIYWTQWEIVDIFCECPQDCQCRPTPESLQALYDGDRAE